MDNIREKQRKIMKNKEEEMMEQRKKQMEEVSHSRKLEEGVIAALKENSKEIFELYKGTIIDSTVAKFMDNLDHEKFPPYEVTYDFDFRKDFFDPFFRFSERHLRKLILEELRQKLTTGEISVSVESAPDEKGYWDVNTWVTTHRYLKTTISIKYTFH